MKKMVQSCEEFQCCMEIEMENDFHSSLLLLDTFVDCGAVDELGIFFSPLLILCKLIYVKSYLLRFEEILLRTRKNKCKVERMKIVAELFDWKFFSATFPILFITIIGVGD